MDAGSKNDFFDSLYHSAAAVGINTSAQIEAGIVGRPVFSIRAPEYAATQEGTLHFHYLVAEHGGLLHMARHARRAHARASPRAFDRTARRRARLRKFVEGFVRPRWPRRAATPLLADAIEQLGQLRLAAPADPFWLRVVRRALRPVAARMKAEHPAAVRQRSTDRGAGRPDREEARVGAQVRARRFLFVMHYPGYLRYFDSVIRMLAARGHHVDLVFDNPDKQAEGTEALADMDGSVEVLGRMPGRGDVWAIVARAVRGTMDYARYLHPNFADTPYLRDRMRTRIAADLRLSRPADDLERRVRAPRHGALATCASARFRAAGSSSVSFAHAGPTPCSSRRS